MRFQLCALLLFVLASPQFLCSQSQVPVSDARAVALAAQTVTALTNGISVNDVTLTGTATWTLGSDSESGAVIFLASGTGESRMDLMLSGGSRTEIRDASTGTRLGKWIAQSGASGRFAFHNCQTDAVWFFPVLGSLATGPNVVLLYVGQESRRGRSVQHIQSYVYSSAQPGGAALQRLSAMDFYLDATTSLPMAVTFNRHPDDDAGSNIPVEVAFSNYETVSGVTVPMRVQEYVQGTAVLDVTIASAAFNTGISVSNFTVN